MPAWPVAKFGSHSMQYGNLICLVPLCCCRLHHPLPSELAALQSAAGSSGPVGRVSPGSDDISNTEEAPMVKQPPVQVR
jgi:hypothetical protein